VCTGSKCDALVMASLASPFALGATVAALSLADSAMYQSYLFANTFAHEKQRTGMIMVIRLRHFGQPLYLISPIL